jgi:predicted transcriptional regulator
MDGPPERKWLNRRDLATEAHMIAEAEAEADAGSLIPSAEVKLWIDSLGTASQVPPPCLPKRSP